MHAATCPQIRIETLLACMLASAKRFNVARVCGVDVELCETINDLDELMAIDMEHATIDLCARLNQSLLQQFSSQMPAKR